MARFVVDHVYILVCTGYITPKKTEKITRRCSRFGFDFINLPISTRGVLYPVGLQQRTKFDLRVQAYRLRHEGRADGGLLRCVAVAACWHVGCGTWCVGCNCILQQLAANRKLPSYEI